MPASSCSTQTIAGVWGRTSVRVHCMAFNQLTEEVRILGGESIEHDQHPEVHDGRVERNEAVKPCAVSTQALHDLNCMMEGGCRAADG